MKHYIIWLVLAACLAGCGSTGSTPTASGAAGAPQVGQDLFGLVQTEGPQAGVSLQVLAGDGSQLYQTRTDDNGVFRLPRSVPIGNRFTVVATLADGSQLERRVELEAGARRPPFLWIDILSHLTSLYQKAHPELTVAQANQALRGGLGIPADLGTNGLSSLPGTPFSARLFLERAAANGGVANYCQSVVDQIGAGKVLAYVPETPLALQSLTTSGDQDVVPYVSGRAFDGILASAATDLAKFVGQTVGANIIDIGTNDLLGMGLSALGLNVGTSAKLKDIQNTLDQVQQEIAALQAQTAAVNVSQEYNDNLGVLNSTIAQLQTSSGQLSASVGAAATAGTNSTTNSSTFDHGPAAVPNVVQEFRSGLSTTVAENSLRQILSYILDSNFAKNQVLLYNQLAATQLGMPAYPEHFYYSVRQDNWTVGAISLQANLDYYRSLVVQAANLLAEAGQLLVLPQPLSQSGLDPPANSLNSSRVGVHQAEIDLVTAQNQVPAPVNYPVLIDLTSNRMWYMQYMGSGGTQLGTAQSAINGFELGPWPAGPPPSSSDEQIFYTSINGGPAVGPAGGWRLANQTEYQQLRALAGGSVAGLARLGFTLPSSYQPKTHIFGNPVYGGLGGYNYYYYDWDKDKPDSEFAYGGGPLYNYLMVRNIPDVSSGDSVTIINTVYGFLPTSLTFGDNSHGVPTQNGLISVFGSFTGAPGTSHIGNRVQWTVSDPGILELTPVGTSVKTSYHAPGNVTVTATMKGSNPAQNQSGGAVQTVVASHTYTSPLTAPDTYVSFQISPYNVAYQAPPRNRDFQQLYLTGFTTGGAAVDLTGSDFGTTWQALDTNGMPLDPEIAQFNPAVPGALDFGPRVLSTTTIKVQATYQGHTATATIVY